ncbi:hypothetical protein ACIO3O_01235 [Streptomyces sp. NPDC087440]|uniref:hypothetical protein n=1 Tax=Streptomyces sp. NPDC087440 TaxID=3365790 RepID=UPI0038256891
MTTDPAETMSESGVGFGDYYRAHAGPLVALSLLRGKDLVEAARLAQDAMTVARRWLDVLDARAAGTVKDALTPVVTAQALRSWTCRMTIGGGCAVVGPAGGETSALLGKGSTDALVQARTVLALAPLSNLNERQLAVTAFRLAGCAPGAIGYELGLSMPKVHRTLRHVGELLEAATGRSGEADAGFARLLAELTAALDPVLDLRAGLDEVNASAVPSAPVFSLWNLGPSLPVPPFGAPVLHSFAEPAPSGVRAYAADLARRDAHVRAAALVGLPVAGLAAVRLGAVLALQVERFRRDAERSGMRATREEFPREDAHAFAVALAQDAALAAPMFDAVKDGLTVPRRIGFLASGVARDDPWTCEVAYDGIEASCALAEFRRAAVRAALGALRGPSPAAPGGSLADAPGGSLADALTQSLSDTHRILLQLDHLNGDLSRAESTLPDGYYVDMTRDFDLHQTFYTDLAFGIATLGEALEGSRSTGSAGPVDGGLA